MKRIKLLANIKGDGKAKLTVLGCPSVNHRFHETQMARMTVTDADDGDVDLTSLVFPTVGNFEDWITSDD